MTEIEDVSDYDLYHYDFTTASDWEIFIARLEEIIHQWQLPSVKQKPPLSFKELQEAIWVKETEKILFADTEFTLNRYHIRDPDVENVGEEEVELEPFDDLMRREYDFVPVLEGDAGEETRPHVLCRWYGLRDFVVLQPAKIAITAESKIKTLLSSFSIALSNTSCPIPIFLRVMEPWQKLYLGTGEGEGARVDFEMIHLRRVPNQCKYLTGLLNLFKSKIGHGPLSEPVSVAARFTFNLKDWTSYVWSQEPPDIDVFHGEVGFKELGHLPFGAIFEPISSLTLHAVWPEVLETVVVDSETYTDFDPSHAPSWFVSVSKAPNLVCLLSDYLNEFVAYCCSNKTSFDLLGDIATRDTKDVQDPFTALTRESRLPSITDILSQYALPRRNSEGPVALQHLLPIMSYLFPDTKHHPEHSGYPDEGEKEVGVGQRFKTAPEGGLIWRLSIVIAHALHMLGGHRAAAHIWLEFARVLRYHWTSSTVIPGVSPGFPDPKTCLIHQKLQMINCCIEAKLKREQASLNPPDSPEEESEDEFFDCDYEGSNDGEDKPKIKHSLWNMPTGRQNKHPTLKLIGNGQPLYIPNTQEPIPKTEDELEEDAQILLHLGNDAEGSQLRARLMSASLLSDMESFKAANPGAIIEDFIRWYSPRDWIEEAELDEYGQKKGHLSARMLLPGNTWLEIWEAAKPVPARRQRRLFDDTREAEKALHFIESMGPGQAGRCLLPVLWHASVIKLKQEAVNIDSPNIHSVIDHIQKKIETLSRQTIVDMRRYQDLCLEVNYVEAHLAAVKSLEQKLCGAGNGEGDSLKGFICSLLTQAEVQVPEGPSGAVAGRIKAMFSEAHRSSQMLYDHQGENEFDSGELATSEKWAPISSSSLPPPQEREFILRCRAPRPGPKSKNLPHRMTVRVSKSEIHCAGAFTQDTVFF